MYVSDVAGPSGLQANGMETGGTLPAPSLPDDTLSICSVPMDELVERTRRELGHKKRKPANDRAGEREKPSKRPTKPSSRGQTSKSRDVEVLMDESSEEEGCPAEDYVPLPTREPRPGSSGTVNHKFIWLNGMWDLDTRPEHLRNPDIVRDMSYQDLDIQYSRFLKQQEEENSKHSLLKKDVLPPRLKFAEGRDDGQRKLHPARWLRLPFSDPKVGVVYIL